MTRLLSAFALLVLAAPLLSAAPPDDPFAAPTKRGRVASFDDLAKAELEVVPAKAARGATVAVRVTVTPTAGAWTYPVNPKDAAQLSKTRFGFRKGGDLILVGPVADPSGAKDKPRDEAKPDGAKDQYYPGPKAVTWELAAVVNPNATPGRQTVGLIPGATQLQVCDKDNCFPARELPVAAFEVLAEAKPVEDRYRDEVEKTLNPPAVASVAGGPPPMAGAGGDASRKTAKPPAEYEAGLAAVRDSLVAADGSAAPTATAQAGSLGGFLATAALWGLISLVTPCVFPMIPITVSIFLKQAHGSLRERVKLAGVYCLTIITVLGTSAFALLKFMAWLSAHPVTNLALAGLFLVLALSLFGMYELTLPNFMVRRLQAKQAKGGVVGTMFGALAFTVISFTCVAPFLGGFAGIAAADAGGDLISLPTAREVFGGLAFATAFAAPFFVLALVPGLLRALPRSGGWLDSVKVVMGFLELAAALKFLRTAELRLLPTPDYFTYDLVLAGWVAICAACGLYLLNVYRLPHDEDRPGIGVPRLLFAVLFLGLGLYLAPALSKTADGKAQRPAGAVYAWVEAFLLPEAEKDWGTDLPDALDRARKSGRPVFVDFTGVTCTNCKYNESNVFTRAEVKERLQQFERVQLYTDEVPAGSFAADPGHDRREAEAVANRAFQIAAFKDSALPLYAVLVPQAGGKVRLVGVYDEGKINAPERFVAYLSAALEAGKK